ncbi:MAG: hypothetical protein U9N04_01450 [Patescibacteria group bacterium]|nr:hypothetical protein [Patescibacteria group bacterium]
MTNITTLIVGIAVTGGGGISVLLFMQTLSNICAESTKYLLVVEAWSAIILLLVGLNILFALDIEKITLAMISLGLLLIDISFLIYDKQKIDYRA